MAMRPAMLMILVRRLAQRMVARSAATAAARARLNAITASTSGRSAASFGSSWRIVPAAERITGQVFVVYGGMVALVAAPVVEQRFDASGAVWDLPDLDRQLGEFFSERDPSVGFAADSIMKLQA